MIIIVSILLLTSCLFFLSEEVLEKYHLQKIKHSLAPFQSVFAVAIFLLSFIYVLKFALFMLINTKEITTGFIGLLGVLIALTLGGSLLLKSESSFLQNMGNQFEDFKRFLSNKKNAFSLLWILGIVCLLSILIVLFM